MQNRKIKIYASPKPKRKGYRPNAVTDFKPSIRISGDWLESAGFTIGDNVSITVAHNVLMLTKMIPHPMPDYASL